MKDLMVDIEAMGTGSYGMIVQIGACYFDIETGDIGDKFSVNISMENGFKEGFVADAGAIKFWLFETNRTFLSGQLLSVREALGKFYAFASDKRIWSHRFDFVLLQQAYEKLGMRHLQYKKARDINTLVWLSGLKNNKVDNVRSGAHDALSDAMYQVGYCTEAYKLLKEGMIATSNSRE
jgi:hypothetical protein